MSYIMFAAAAVIIATVAIFVDRRLVQNRQRDTEKPVEQIEAKNEEQIETKPRGIKQYIGDIDLKGYLPGQKQNLAGPFQKWVADNVEQETLKQWLLSLSPEASQALAIQINEFCTDLNCELSWLIDKQLDGDPEIEHKVRDMVLSYCTACWHAAHGYTDFELFKIIEEVEHHPFAKKNRSISNKVFARLVKEGLAPSVPADLFLSSEKERQAHMAQAIHQAATSNRNSFKQVLRDVLNEELDAAKADVAKSSSSSKNGTQQATTDNDAGESEKKPRRMFGKKAKADPETPEVAGSEPVSTVVSSTGS